MLTCKTLLAQTNALPHARSITINGERITFSNEVAEANIEVKILSEKNVNKKDSLYQELIRQFPEDTLKPSRMHDFIRSDIIVSYLRENDIANCARYVALITNNKQLVNALNRIAWQLAEQGQNLELAEQLSKKSVDIVNSEINNPVATPYITAELAKQRAQGSASMCGDTYAFILYKEGKYTDALQVIKPVYDNIKTKGGAIALHYVQILCVNNDYEMAKKVAETAMMVDNVPRELEVELKKVYIKVNGDEKGYDEYLSRLKPIAKDYE